MMVDTKTITTVLIIAACIMAGLFLVTLKRNDRLTAREMSVLGFFRGLTMWSAVVSYLIATITFLGALVIRVGIVSQDDVFAMLGQPIAMHLQAWGLLYVAAFAFTVASISMILMILIAIELHLRRIAEQVDRRGYFNN